MELRIGISHSNQPITVTLPDETDRSDLRTSIESCLRGKGSLLWLTDDKGREIAIAASRITHVEISPAGSNPIGFG